MSAEQVYEDITDTTVLKNSMAALLKEYNGLPGVLLMDLVLFRDAIEHG